MKKFLITIIATMLMTSAWADQPKNWQLGFQDSASQSMTEIVSFHNNILLPVIIAISVFVLFLMIYVCIRFRASNNPNPSKTTHNVAVEVLWTLIPCLILIVMAVPSFKILYKQDTIPKADLTIKAVGYQWYWGYEYPDENIIFESYMIKDEDLKENQPRLLTVDNEVIVPVNKVVKVLITAVIKTLTTLLTGTITSLSTVSNLGWFSFRSSSLIIYDSKIIFSSGYSYPQYHW